MAMPPEVTENQVH